MSRIPPELAPRLDRLARHAHRFHRLAHHPLCAPYGPELIRVGRRTRLCRGCAALALGSLAGLAAGLLTPPRPDASLLGGLAVLIPVGLLAVAPRRGWRLPKLLTRALPAALGVALCGSALRAGTPVGLAVAGAAALTALLGLAGWRGRGPDRAACEGCPQAPAGPRCEGLRPVARRERALSRLAGRWVARATRRA
jgi:hypothetical protein